MPDICYSELECKIIRDQIERRARYRCEFMRAKSDPCKHSKEAGYIFDPAIQRFMSMKSVHYEYFKPNLSALYSGIFALIPMFIMGAAAYYDRSGTEQKIRCGELKYRDRMFKFQ